MAAIATTSSALTTATLVNGPSTQKKKKLPKIIPPPNDENGQPRPRTLVLCFDGTGDQFDADNSNVIQFFSLLQKYDHTQQMVYYQAGIGTYTVPQIATPLWASFSKTVDAAIAWNLDAHVMDGYAFLMQNYQANDKICIFGFSRGAYTARSLAGMIHKVGLLPADNHQQVPFAYKMYTRCDNVGWEQSVAFKKAFSIDVKIEFVGVWDTVNSVGLIPKRLPFVSSNTAIRFFRHAVSLDERRAKFKANLYNRPTRWEAALGVGEGEMPSPRVSGEGVGVGVGGAGVSSGVSGSGGKETKEEEDLKKVVPETDVLEVWFAGCHCDVGGGSVRNNTRHNLARIPLRWMIRQCFLANTGIRFHTSLLRQVGLDPEGLYPVVKERPRAVFVKTPHALLTRLTISPPGTLTEEEEDLADALCPIYDQLEVARVWWVLEVLPFVQRWQVPGGEGRWEEGVWINRGRGRDVPTPLLPETFNVHRTVDVRMKATGYVRDRKGGVVRGVYRPRARYDATPVWVD
ncbi:hypothetical protein BDY19DRAFT_900387 [Irpex rosettiformis]|uniref:Uncharacterized protein n=1 Tax=Irpex rosettiformis TaxID=378272 RepID=A0ACB8TN12_9APHY|nr:hypothetical protein BDY19DRAFT_900387 [Irpex rosettiformis]